MNTFGIHIYGASAPPMFMQIGSVFHPDVADRSLEHDGSGEVPGIQYEDGGWDLRPHAARVVTITEDVLADWARLFDEPGTPAAEARLLRPVTKADLAALSVLADQPVRLADHDYHWSSGWHEKGAKTDGIIEWDTRVPDSWDEVILQGPHFTIATPFNKQPNENCQHNQDYSEWDLENLPDRVIPRTNYQRACDRDTYDASLDHWRGWPSTSRWRLCHRLMTQPGLERSLQSAIILPGPSHIHGVQSTLFKDSADLVRWGCLTGSTVLDYLAKVTGTANLSDTYLHVFPLPRADALDATLAVRYLRLNSLTADYAPLWEELYMSAWAEESWTLPYATMKLGEVGPEWTMATPLRRDVDRRQALVEIDALAALMLGLTAEQLCAMYRTQFPVLRKYEYAMAFDAEGRKLCGHHQSAGFRQSQLQQQAKDGDLPPEWKSIWKLLEQWEDDHDSVDWRGHFHPPFYRPNREAEMTMAYNEFQRRLAAGLYGEPS